MYADMTLPGAEANFAMKRDLQMTKADRNALRLENACVLLAPVDSPPFLPGKPP